LVVGLERRCCCCCCCCNGSAAVYGAQPCGDTGAVCARVSSGGRGDTAAAVVGFVAARRELWWQEVPRGELAPGEPRDGARGALPARALPGKNKTASGTAGTAVPDNVKCTRLGCTACVPLPTRETSSPYTRLGGSELSRSVAWPLSVGASAAGGRWLLLLPPEEELSLDGGGSAAPPLCISLAIRWSAVDVMDASHSANTVGGRARNPPTAAAAPTAAPPLEPSTGVPRLAAGPLRCERRSGRPRDGCTVLLLLLLLMLLLLLLLLVLLLLPLLLLLVLPLLLPLQILLLLLVVVVVVVAVLLLLLLLLLTPMLLVLVLVKGRPPRRAPPGSREARLLQSQSIPLDS
jgi:hypothetical protein